ncbi:transposase [Yersinia pestis biovar Medievalis str. Harbin 35]|nr:transposase [Yersinia pestis biovar Medievalis str. Harbin 35]EEO74576.1 Transposase [Yersinia pestis Nepal516]EEO83210.1 Transposase [Yersinia pestis biovar Orientalis str. India 195]EEO86147.1 Transposase [Yersinia pestis biovar Orientalis str. PEXU2]EEO92706.1 Transposase [Yersinia pestis Pestoides A]
MPRRAAAQENQVTDPAANARQLMVNYRLISLALTMVIEYTDRNQAVARQRLTGSNAYWKWNTAYNRRSVAETAMYRVKQLFGRHLTLRDYDALIGETIAMIRALNKMTRASMLESVRIA